MDRYLTADEAADALGIRIETLYAYVSRGLVRSEPAPDGSRAKRYLAEDVRRLQRRQVARKNPEQVAEPPLAWGLPVFDSAITLIEDNHLFYRGYDAANLATSRTAEDVAGLLWKGVLDTPVNLPDLTDEGLAIQQSLSTMLPCNQPDPLPAFQILVNWLGANDKAGYDFRPSSVIHKGALILRHLVYLVSGQRSGNIAGALQHAWAEESPGAGFLINAALILCSDHELNASSFTVRCIASTLAPVHAAIAGGMSALAGSRHGGASLAVEALFEEADRTGDPERVVAGRLRRGEPVPGFGHRLYPEGDPRARTLLTLCKPTEQETALAGAVWNLTGLEPNLEFGLVALARSMQAPAGSALTMMTIGRTIGWIAHAIEEYQRNEIIRPRARYAGPPPIDHAPATG